MERATSKRLATFAACSASPGVHQATALSQPARIHANAQMAPSPTSQTSAVSSPLKQDAARARWSLGKDARRWWSTRHGARKHIAAARQQARVEEDVKNYIGVRVRRLQREWYAGADVEGRVEGLRHLPQW